jgi:hypothetical protein
MLASVLFQTDNRHMSFLNDGFCRASVHSGCLMYVLNNLRARPTMLLSVGPIFGFAI